MGKRMAGGEKFRDKIEERKGTEWYDAALKEGLHDPHMSRDGETARYSGAEVRAEMRAGRGDRTVGEMVKYFEDEYASGRMNLNGNAKEYLTQKHGANLQRSGGGGGSDPKPEPSTGGGGGPSTITDSPITIGGDVNPKPTPRSMPTPKPGAGGGTTQVVDQSRNLGSSFVGNVAGNNNNIDLSNTDNSYNSVTGGDDYRPDFMKFIR